MESPSDLLARAQVWRNYKHHSTEKVLIGITEQFLLFPSVTEEEFLITK